MAIYSYMHVKGEGCPLANKEPTFTDYGVTEMGRHSSFSLLPFKYPNRPSRWVYYNI